MPANWASRAILLWLLPPLLQSAQQLPTNSSSDSRWQKTLFVTCHENEKPKHVLSPVSLSEEDNWRAYVEVDVQSELGCQSTTRLWVSSSRGPDRLVYLIPPERTAVENGMEILGWATHSTVLLVKTEEWQLGSDAPDTQRILAIDARTGMVYAPELEAMLQAHKEKQCSYRVTDAGFAAGRSVNILVRAKFYTALDVDETEADIPLAKRCGNAEETWSFNFDTGEIEQVENTQPLHLVKKSPPARRGK